MYNWWMTVRIEEERKRELLREVERTRTLRRGYASIRLMPWRPAVAALGTGIVAALAVVSRAL